MKRALATDDLSVLARRGELEPSERRRLDMLLGASPLERWLHETGSDFDQMSTDVEEDPALLDRVVERAAAPRAAGFARRRGVAIAAIVAAGLATIAAAAVTLPRWLSVAPVVAPSRCERCPSEIAPSPARAAQPRVAPAIPVPARPPRQGADWPVPAASSPVPAVPEPSPAHVPVPVSAADQFAQANALRKSGQLALAIAAYRQLQRSHPESPQAALSHVLLGRILLQQGAAGAAHEQFARYLRSSKDGSLAEDALYGEAAALRMSGSTAEERKVHEQLIARFPNSIHARASRARLLELD